MIYMIYILCLGIFYCFECLGSQVAAYGGCEGDVMRRMNEGYGA